MVAINLINKVFIIILMMLRKVTVSALKNPYGSIFRAALFAKALRSIWKARTSAENKFYCCMGVISDGSLRTTKGMFY